MLDQVMCLREVWNCKRNLFPSLFGIFRISSFFLTWLSVHVHTQAERERERNERKDQLICLLITLQKLPFPHGVIIEPSPLAWLAMLPRPTQGVLEALHGLRLHPQNFQVTSQRQLKSFTSWAENLNRQPLLCELLQTSSLLYNFYL